MIYDLDELAKRFTWHLDPPEEMLRKAKSHVLKKFQETGINLSHVKNPVNRMTAVSAFDTIMEFAAVGFIYTLQQDMLSRGIELKNPVHPPREGLWLYGGFGTGKTLTAKFLSSVMGVEFYDSRELDREYSKRGYEIFSEKTAMNHGICVIDDLGSEAGSRFYGNAPMMVYLLEQRYDLWIDKRIPTILTTNIVGSKDIAKVYNERVLSRIHEMCTHISYGDNDQRIHKNTERKTA